MKNLLGLLAFTCLLFFISCDSKKKEEKPSTSDNTITPDTAKKADAITSNITADEAKEMIVLFKNDNNKEVCKTLSVHFPAEQVNRILNMNAIPLNQKASALPVRVGEGLRFYFGKRSENDKYFIIATPTLRGANGFADNPPNGNYILSEEPVCPKSCNGARLIEAIYKRTNSELKYDCEAIYFPGEDNGNLDGQWGNTERNKGERFVKEYFEGTISDSCKALAISFTDTQLRGIQKMFEKYISANKHKVSDIPRGLGLRVYFGINDRRDLTVVATVTKASPPGDEVVYSDVLKGSGSTAYRTLDNGSRHPPGRDATLINQLITARRVSDCTGQIQIKKRNQQQQK